MTEAFDRLKSKLLQEMQQEEMTAEPSLDRMVDLSDPKVLSGLGRLAAKAKAEQSAGKED